MKVSFEKRPNRALTVSKRAWEFWMISMGHDILGGAYWVVATSSEVGEVSCGQVHFRVFLDPNAQLFETVRPDGWIGVSDTVDEHAAEYW